MGRGTTANITDGSASLGTNLLTISPTGASAAATLTLDDADGDREGRRRRRGRAGDPDVGDGRRGRRRRPTTSIVGTTAAYATVRAYDVWQGTFLTDVAVDAALRVAVLGATVASDLGLGATAIGTTVSIDGMPFEVVGILQPKGGSRLRRPGRPGARAARRRSRSTSSAATASGRSASASPTGDEMRRHDAIAALLRAATGSRATADDDFSIFDQTQLLEAASSISGTLTLLLGGIASIALIVGGIGIMNIMLVSVRERTREIGIRKARRRPGRDILAQFLIEALTLSLLGGLIGIVVGLAVSALIASSPAGASVFNPTSSRRPLQPGRRRRVRRLARPPGRPSRPGHRPPLRIAQARSQFHVRLQLDPAACPSPARRPAPVPSARLTPSR